MAGPTPAEKETPGQMPFDRSKPVCFNPKRTVGACDNGKSIAFDKDPRRGVFADMSFVTSAALGAASRVGLPFQLLIAAYVIAVILFNREAGLLLAVPKVLAPLIGLAFVVLVIGQERKIYVPMTFRIWAVWFFVAITSTLLADDVRLGRIVTLATLAGVGFFITNFLIWNRDTRFYVLALIGGVAASSLWVLIDPASYIVDGRASGTIGNANAHGVLLSVGLVLSVMFGWTIRHWLAKILFFLFAIWVFVQLLQTGSRQAFIGAIVIVGGSVGGAFLYRSWRAGHRSFLKSIMAFSMVASVAVIALSKSKFWGRMLTAQEALTGEESADGSIRGRMWMIRRGLELWADHPMLGLGLNNFRFSLEADHFFASTIGTYSHNNYIEILVSTGLIGLLLYVSIYLLWLFKLFFLSPALKYKDSFFSFVVVLSVVLLVIATDFTRVSHYEKLFWILVPLVVAELHFLESKKTRLWDRGSSR